MLRNFLILAFLVETTFAIFYSPSAQAKDIPVQARFFAGIGSSDPKNVNDVITTQGMKKVDGTGNYGFEATYPVLRYLDIGVRYTKRTADKDENPTNGSTDYSTKIDQDSVLLLARVPIIKTDFLRLDAFGGVGGTNTTLKIKTSSQDGELTRRASADWFASPYTAFGGSIALGYKQFYFVVEGGVESNKVTGFSRSGNVNSSIDTLDLSGSYFTVGLMFDGLSGTIK